jgi:hypothetical protein
MKWLEIIELRSPKQNKGMLEKDLDNLMNNMNCEGKSRKACVFKKGSLETDYSIHLYHDTKPSDIRESKVGQCLVSTLKEHGLVNHSIWIEMSV